MKNKEDMLFRKAGRGYNKEDVNKYIITMSQQINKQSKAITESNKENSELTQVSIELKSRIAELENQISLEKENSARLLSENKLLARKIINSEKRSEEIYEDLCNKAGEVLVIATEAATEVLKKAGKEVGVIISDARDAKEQLTTNIYPSKVNNSELTDSVNKTFSECVSKINETIDSVEATKEMPEIIKPKLRFINGN